MMQDCLHGFDHSLLSALMHLPLELPILNTDQTALSGHLSHSAFDWRGSHAHAIYSASVRPDRQNS